MYAHDNTNTFMRTKIVARKFGRNFIWIDERKIGTSLQDNLKEGYNLNGREIWNFGKEFYTLKNIVRSNTSNARVQFTL